MSGKEPATQRYPFIEPIGGRVYFHLRKPSARGVALLTLWYVHPNRLHTSKVIEALENHGYSKNNARVTTSRLSVVVDNDGAGNLLLLAPGVREAEDLLLSNS